MGFLMMLITKKSFLKTYLVVKGQFEWFNVIRGGFEPNLISYIQVELGVVLGIFEDADDENNIFGGVFYPFVIVVGRNVIKRVVFSKDCILSLQDEGRAN